MTCHVVGTIIACDAATAPTEIANILGRHACRTRDPGAHSAARAVALHVDGASRQHAAECRRPKGWWAPGFVGFGRESAHRALLQGAAARRRGSDQGACVARVLCDSVFARTTRWRTPGDAARVRWAAGVSESA